MQISNVRTGIQVLDDWCGTKPRPLPWPRPKEPQALYPHFLDNAGLVGFNPQPEPPKAPPPDDSNPGIIDDELNLVGFNPQPEPPLNLLSFPPRVR